MVQNLQCDVIKVGNDLTRMIAQMNSMYLMLNSLADIAESNLHQTLEQDGMCESVESAMFSINEAKESIIDAVKQLEQIV